MGEGTHASDGVVDRFLLRMGGLLFVQSLTGAAFVEFDLPLTGRGSRAVRDNNTFVRTSVSLMHSNEHLCCSSSIGRLRCHSGRLHQRFV
jgi:hypothetical protein